MTPTHSPNMALSVQMPAHSAALGGLHHPQMGLIPGAQSIHHPSAMNCNPYQPMLSHPMQGQMGVTEAMVSIPQMGLAMPVAPIGDVAT